MATALLRRIFPENAFCEAMALCSLSAVSRGWRLVTALIENPPSFDEMLLRIRLAVWVTNPCAGGRKEKARRQILEACELLAPKRAELPESKLQA